MSRSGRRRNGLSAAVARARALAHLPADARVQAVHTSASVLNKLAGDGDDDEQSDPAASLPSAALAPAIRAAGGASVAVPGSAAMSPDAWMRAADHLAPGLAPYAVSLWSFTQGETVLAAVPYGLVVH